LDRDVLWNDDILATDARIVTVAGRHVLLIIAGGIAAYKTLELIRRLRDRGCGVRAILTRSAREFVTPLSVASLTGESVHTELFSLTDEVEIGHIQLSRSADLIVVAPATADILAKMAAGLADDLATTTLLATDTDVLAAPAMNVRMWDHPATQANIARLKERGVRFVGPDEGPMACGEFGPGRMAEPGAILAAIEGMLAPAARPLAGRTALVTSGPTHEPIDPVRFIGNRSSGRQGHAIAGALAALGARVTLVTGPVIEPDPAGTTVVRIQTAREMLEACRAALPAEIAVCAAAVADWRVADEAGHKIKKGSGPTPTLRLVENPDILATLSAPGPERPALVVGFAAETENVVPNAVAKRQRKGCDWIVANDVSPETGTFGGAENSVHLVTESGVETWPRMSKNAVAERLAAAIAGRLGAGG
jgi:phosphopantothenoylcysteine decarboxylase/phosphopantothenate--cysteine ligase